MQATDLYSVAGSSTSQSTASTEDTVSSGLLFIDDPTSDGIN